MVKIRLGVCPHTCAKRKCGGRTYKDDNLHVMNQASRKHLCSRAAHPECGPGCPKHAWLDQVIKGNPHINFRVATEDDFAKVKYSTLKNMAEKNGWPIPQNALEQAKLVSKHVLSRGRVLPT